MLTDWYLRIRALVRPHIVDQELEDELRFHIEQQVAQNLRSGLTLDEARRRARLEVGGLDLIKEEHRDARGVRAVDDAARDIACAARQLRRMPGVALTVILSLGFAIGVNTALFSVADAVLLRPLPYPAAERLVRIDGVFTQLPVRVTDTGTELAFPVAAPELEEARSLVGVGAFGVGSANVGEVAPERLTVATVTPAFFEVLGAAPTLGRTFSEDEVRDSQRLAIISRRLWARRFQSDASAVGQVLVLNGQSFTVLGVMPDRMEFPDGTDVWIPQASDPQLASTLAAPAFVARLTEQATTSGARDELIGRLAHQRLTRQDPRSPSLTVSPLRDALVRDVRPALVFVVAAALLALSVACLNTASLLLTRVKAREREFAIRRAVGASSRRLVRQVLTESLLLAALAATVAAPIALETLKVAHAFVPPGLHGSGAIALDVRALAVLALLVLTVAGLIGLAPSWSAQGRRVGPLRASAAVGEDRRWRWLRSSLVTVQIAMAVAILIAAGTLVQTVGALLEVDVGPKHDQAVVLEVTLPRATYSSREQIHSFYDRLHSELQSVPGLRAAGATNHLPGSAPVLTPSLPIAVEGVASQDNAAGFALRLAATPDYFAALGIDVVSGRPFTAVDREAGALTAIVSAGYARALGMEPADIVGRRVNVSLGTPQSAEVVGVVRDLRMRGPESDLRPAVYVPFAQTSLNATGFVAVDADAGFEQIVGSVRSAVARVDAGIPATNLRTFGDVRSDYLATRRFTMTTLATFGALAAVLSAVGLFGILSYLVRLRRREFAMRIVLGATPTTVRRAVFIEGTAHALLGIVIGAASALALWRVVAAHVPGLHHVDAPRAALACLAVLALSVGAAWAPARRAAGADALASLRLE